jgi:hypothetical protein
MPTSDRGIPNGASNLLHDIKPMKACIFSFRPGLRGAEILGVNELS